MKRFQILLAAAIVFATGSAFTNAKVNFLKTDKADTVAVNFVRVSGSSNSTNRLDYQYRPSNACDDSSTSPTCKADWLQNTATPAIGSNPEVGATFDAVTETGTRVIQ